MSEMSVATEDDLVLHYFRTGDATAVTVMAIALMTTTPVESDDAIFLTGGTGVEVTNANGYLRQDEPPLDANWSATAGDGQTDNVAAITFPQAITATWGTVAGIAMCSSATHNVGTMYFFTAVDTAKAINVDDTAEFAIGAITVTFN